MTQANPGIRPRKSLGQHFLIDDNIARNIVRDLQLSPNDVVVEIGPGRGALTKHVAPRVRKLVAVEVDARAVEELRAQVRFPNTEVVHQDFLEFDLVGLSKHEGQRLRLIGNIPYNLTSEIILKAFDERASLQDFTFMVQREVARRLAARPGTKEYGILSVYAQLYGQMKVLFSVSQNCFYPKPAVSSAVIQEKLFESLPYMVDENMFRTVVRTTFGKRRKTLRNSLKYLPWEHLLRDARLSPSLLDKRPEQLSVEEFVELTNLLTQHSHTLHHATY